MNDIICGQNPQIIGRWVNFNTPTDFLQFDSSGYYNMYNSLSGFILKKNSYRYSLEIKNDSTINLEIENLFKAIIYKKQDYFILYNYKEGIEIKNHIDEVGLFYREGVSKESLDFSTEPKTFITIPDGFLGTIFIAFNQANGKPFATDENNNTYIVVEKSGFLETQLIENPLKFAKKNELIKYENSSNSIPLISKGFSRTSSFLFPQTTICALAEGFNQQSREKLNSIIGKKIKGNVETYVVDTYENLIKLDK